MARPLLHSPSKAGPLAQSDPTDPEARTNRMTKPTFLYIGADKAGSTWIYKILEAHPAVYVPEVKDLYYFDKFYHFGADWYGRHFAGAPHDAAAVGELSHDYLYSAEAIDRIATDLPGVRLLVSLRDPVERAVSHYKYMLRVGRTRAPLSEALEFFPEILDHSRYAEHLTHVYKRFPPDQVRLLWFDDLKADPVAFGRQLCEAVGAPFFPDLPYEERVLEGGRARAPGLVNLLRKGGWALRAIGLSRLVGIAKYNPLLQRTLFERGRFDANAAPPADILQAMAASLAPDIHQLQAMTGRDLTGWGANPRSASSEI